MSKLNRKQVTVLLYVGDFVSSSKFHNMPNSKVYSKYQEYVSELIKLGLIKPDFVNSKYGDGKWIVLKLTEIGSLAYKYYVGIRDKKMEDKLPEDTSLIASNTDVKDFNLNIFCYVLLHSMASKEEIIESNTQFNQATEDAVVTSLCKWLKKGYIAMYGNKYVVTKEGKKKYLEFLKG